MPSPRHSESQPPSRWRGDSGEAGQGVVEYAFLTVLIALVVLLMVVLLGNTTQNVYSNISNVYP